MLQGLKLWWMIWYIARCVVDSVVIAFSSCRYMTRQSAKQRVVALSSCRPVSSEARQTASCRAARCRDVALSLGLANPSIRTERQCDIATTRRTTTRRFAYIVSDRTT
jgi:hypothetical protein